jgi:hypothetical protein
MSKAQNRNMGTKRRQGNITPQMTHSHTIENFVNCEGNISPFTKYRRMMIIMLSELKV